MFVAHQRFGPWNGESWTSYIQWSGFHHIRELISTDEMLCPAVLKELLDADWQYNIHADCQTYFFNNLDYLKRRINFDPARHNILSLIDRPSSLKWTPKPGQLDKVVNPPAGVAPIRSS